MRTNPSKRHRVRRSLRPIAQATALLRRAGVVWDLRRTDAGLWLVDFYSTSGFRLSVRTPQNAPVPPVVALMIYVHGAFRSRLALGSQEWCEVSGFFWPLEGRAPEAVAEATEIYQRDAVNLRLLRETFGNPLVQRLARLTDQFFR